MNSYETLSEYYDRFTDDVPYERWADFFVDFHRSHSLFKQLL